MKKFIKSRDNYAGYVYIASNPAFSYLKIGYTTQTVEERLRQLSEETGVPAPYKEEYSVYTRRCGILEKRIHLELADKRTKTIREFFDVPVDEARNTLNRLFRELETEIDNNPRQLKIDEIKNLLVKIKDDAYLKRDWAVFRKAKADISYLNHVGYGEDSKYKKCLEIENKIQSWNGY